MRKTALTAALIAVTTLAACGDTADKNAYVGEVTKVQQSTNQEATALSDAMASAKTPAQVASKLTALAKSIEANAKKLDAIEAPEEVAADHQKYVDLMNDFGTDLEALAVKVKKATPTTVPTLLSEASTLTTRLSTGETAIVNKINSELQS